LKMVYNHAVKKSLTVQNRERIRCLPSYLHLLIQNRSSSEKLYRFQAY
jgi:hypothetical protein